MAGGTVYFPDPNKEALTRFKNMLRTTLRMVETAEQDQQTHYMLAGVMFYTRFKKHPKQDPAEFFAALEKIAQDDLRQGGEDAPFASLSLLGQVGRGVPGMPSPGELAGFLQLAGFQPVKFVESQVIADPSRQLDTDTKEDP